MSDQALHSSSSAGEIARSTVQLFAEVIGRGPTKARAHLEEDVLTIVLSETLTRPERRLIQGGHTEAVQVSRRAMHQTMEAPIVELVERVTERSVLSVHLDHALDADVLVVVCVFAE